MIELRAVEPGASLPCYEKQLSVAASQAFWEGSASAEKNYHYNEEVARAIGFPGLLISAPHLRALASEAMGHLFGDVWLRNGEIDIKFVGMVFAGATAVVRPTVAEIVVNGGSTTVVVDLRVDEGDLETRPVCVGKARVTLPDVR